MSDYSRSQADAVLEACARAAHEVNRTYCIATGDASQVAWDAAPEWQRSSARKGVAAALDLAAEVDTSGDFSRVDRIPEQLHESWCEEKLRDGWVHGPTKDPERKTHPCLVPYAQLPAAQRVKDELFLSVVVAVKHALDEGLK